MSTLSPRCFRRSSAMVALASTLVLSSPRLLYAEGLVSYKYQDYREGDGRIAVQTQSASFEQDLNPATRIKVQGVIDAIAGATPNGQPAPAGSDQVVLTHMDEKRKAWNADFSHQFTSATVALGVANSRESDYVSNGWSLNTLSFINQKNTTLLAGIAGTDDKVRVFYQSAWAKKRTNDLIIGVNQLLDPHTAVTVNLSWGRATGYLADPYKLVQKSVEVAPGVFLPFTYGENRPDERTRWTLFSSLNRDLPSAHGALEATYRYTHDNLGMATHLVELHWLQKLGAKFVLQPEFRVYAQSAADFYFYRLDGTAITPTGGAPRPDGPFYSSDYRLSKFRSYLYGLKLIWTPNERWQFDAAIEQYDLRGSDGVTAQSAYPSAAIVTVGGRFSW